MPADEVSVANQCHRLTGNKSSRKLKFLERILFRTKVPGNENSWSISLWVAKVPGSETVRECKCQEATVPGNELARVLLELSLQGANWPGNEKAVIKNASLERCFH